jgi:signal transduction histidine kinase
LVNLIVDHKPVPIGGDSPLKQAIDQTNALSLPAGARSFSLQFVAPNYRAPEKIRYRYRLDGFDADWVEMDSTSTKRRVTYTNLDPGTYLFRVVAAGPNGTWSDVERTLRITIEPSLWQTWWFRLGAALLVMGLVGGLAVVIQHARVGSFKKQKRELEAQVAERTEEIGALLAVSQSVTSALDFHPLLTLFLDGVERVIPHTGSVVLLIEGDEFVISAFRDARQPRDNLTGRRFPIKAFPQLESIGQFAQPFIIRDATEDANIAAAVASLIDNPPHIRACIAAPLIARGTVIGVLGLTHEKRNMFDSDDMPRLQAFANQLALSIDNARLYARSKQLAIFEERSRLARELHDSVTQSLHSIGLYANAAERAMDLGKQEVGVKNLHEVRKLAREAMHEIRSLIFELRPTVLDERGLGPALQARLDSVEARSGLVVSLETPDQQGERRLPVQTEMELYRIAQEALTNVIKHAGASHVWVTLRYEDSGNNVGDDRGWHGCVVLEIRDDGVGFDLQTARERGTLGLSSITERAEKIGGMVTINTIPNGGTSVKIEVRYDNSRENGSRENDSSPGGR